jgi:hypothetical protein
MGGGKRPCATESDTAPTVEIKASPLPVGNILLLLKALTPVGWYQQSYFLLKVWFTD